MDSESPRDPNFTLNSATVPIDRIVLFQHAVSAEIFLQQVFVHDCNCIVASADQVFPRNRDLATLVFRALAKDPKIRVVVFNLSALKQVKLCSDRVLLMDDLIMQDFKHHPAERQTQLGFSAEKIAFFIHCFFNQWDRMHRIGNTSYPYRHFREYRDWDWKADLIAPTE